MGFTLVFDGLFLMLGGIISGNSGPFIAPTYLLYVSMMLIIPFFYYFATRFLIKKEGVEEKDFWMLEVVAVFALFILAVLNRIPVQERNLFQSILSNSTGFPETVPTGTAVLLGIDDLAFLIFLAEQLFIQIFCFSSLYEYKKTLSTYYSNTEGKSIDIIYIVFILVAVRFIIYIGTSLFPDTAASGWYHIIQSVASCMFYIIIALFTCKIKYTAEELGKMIAEQNAKPAVPVANELIKSRLDELIQSRFYTDPDTDLMKVAAKLQVNYKYLTDYLRYSYNESFMVFVNRLRVEYAASLLKEGKTSLEDISEKTGFISVSTLYRNFVKYIGFAPSKYKKK